MFDEAALAPGGVALMVDRSNERWHGFAQVVGACLCAAGVALPSLGRCAGDQGALNALFMAMYRCRMAAQSMALPVAAAQAGRIEALSGLLLTFGMPLDDETLFLLVEACGSLHAAIEAAVLCRQDIHVPDYAALGPRLQAQYDAFLLAGVPHGC